MGIEAKAAVFTARAGIRFSFYEWQFEVGASINALSVGFQYGIGIEDGTIYYTKGFSKVFGYGFYIRIKFS